MELIFFLLTCVKIASSILVKTECIYLKCNFYSCTLLFQSQFKIINTANRWRFPRVRICPKTRTMSHWKYRRHQRRREHPRLFLLYFFYVPISPALPCHARRSRVFAEACSGDDIYQPESRLGPGDDNDLGE